MKYTRERWSESLLGPFLFPYVHWDGKGRHSSKSRTHQPIIPFRCIHPFLYYPKDLINTKTLVKKNRYKLR